MTASLNYPIVLYPCEESGYMAEVPTLKGCLAQGETLVETLGELETVKQLWMETAEKLGRSLPDSNSGMTTIWVDAHLSPAIATWITNVFDVTALAFVLFLCSSKSTNIKNLKLKQPEN